MKKGFSLIELLVSLITISIIIASMAPVITHKLKQNRVALKSKSVKIDCAKEYGTDCMMCNEKSCLWCSTYINIPDGQYVDPSFGCERKNCQGKFGSTCTKCTKDYCLGCTGGYGYNNTNHSCIGCNAPYYSPGGSSGCLMCNQGYKYQNENLKTDCKECDSANGWFPNADRLGCTLKTCPKGYKREGTNCTPCQGNTYQPYDNYSGSSCYSCGSNSAPNSDHAGCHSTCESSSSCGSNQTYDGCHCVAKQASCDSDAVLIGSFCMKKRNAGDLGGPSISGISGVDKAECFSGTTTSSCNNVSGWDYDACKRTVCNWYAANAICKSIGWTLPTENHLESLQTYYYGVLNNSLQLCDNSGSSTVSKCTWSSGSCLGSYTNGSCMPDTIWGESISTNEALVGSLYSNGTRFAYYKNSVEAVLWKTLRAYSVRCVKDAY